MVGIKLTFDKISFSSSMTDSQQQQLKAIFTQPGPLAPNELEACYEICSSSQVKKGDFITKADEAFEQEILVLKGVIRGFYLTYEGEEFNAAFYTDQSIVSPWFTRTHQGISLINLQAMEDTEVAFMHQKTFENARYSHPGLREYGYRVVEADLLQRAQREILMATKSARERYLAFQEQFPGLENRISQYHIASYLGITPISLSRIRAELMKGSS